MMDMRVRLQLQGIVLILFGILLVLIAGSGPIGGILQVVLLLLALVIGIIGLMLSLSKDNSGK